MRASILNVRWMAVLLLSSASMAQELPTEPIVCEYPRLPERQPFASLDPTRLTTAAETEPNNSATAAQDIPLGFGPGQQQDVDVTGLITSFDKDWFRFQARGAIPSGSLYWRLTLTISIHM